MIHFKLGERRAARPKDEMGRDWVGYVPGMTEQEVYDRNRGVWFLGRRAERERYAVFSDLAEHLTRAVVEVDTLQEFPDSDKKAVVGHLLQPGHPIYDALMGQPAPDRFRNPKTYPPDPATTGPWLCLCGCGQPVGGRGLFLPGHDQRGIHDRITRGWGSAAAFIRWFDQNYSEPT